MLDPVEVWPPVELINGLAIEAPPPETELDPNVEKGTNNLRSHIHGGFLDSMLLMVILQNYPMGPKFFPLRLPEQVLGYRRYALRPFREMDDEERTSRRCELFFGYIDEVISETC